MAIRLPLSGAAAGNRNINIQHHTASGSGFVLNTNLFPIHVSTGQDEVFVEVTNVDTVPHQLVGAIYQGAIASPDDLFYQTIPPRSGWHRTLAGDYLPAGAGVAFGAYSAADAGKLNIRGFANQILDGRLLSLNGAYNKNKKVGGIIGTNDTLIYTPVAGTPQYDEVWLAATNTSASPVQLAVVLGGWTGDTDRVWVTVPPQCGWMPVLAGEPINNGLEVRAAASVANVVNLRGKVIRVG